MGNQSLIEALVGYANGGDRARLSDGVCQARRIGGQAIERDLIVGTLGYQFVVCIIGCVGGLQHGQDGRLSASHGLANHGRTRYQLAGSGAKPQSGQELIFRSKTTHITIPHLR